MNKRWTWASREGLYDTPSWRKLRSAILTEEPLCRMCASMGIYVSADMVDHIEPITELNWKELFLDPDNLQPLCHACHGFKTARDKKRHDSCDDISIDEILDL